MIKSDLKNGICQIDGDMVSVLDEFTMLCRSLRECLTKAQDEDFAERTIVFCMWLSRKSEEEMEAEDEADNRKSLN